MRPAKGSKGKGLHLINEGFGSPDAFSVERTPGIARATLMMLVLPPLLLLPRLLLLLLRAHGRTGVRTARVHTGSVLPRRHGRTGVRTARVHTGSVLPRREGNTLDEAKAIIPGMPHVNTAYPAMLKGLPRGLAYPRVGGSAIWLGEGLSSRLPNGTDDDSMMVMSMDIHEG